eukprot:6492589-Amphidinium_carterae.2
MQARALSTARRKVPPDNSGGTFCSADLKVTATARAANTANQRVASSRKAWRSAGSLSSRNSTHRGLGSRPYWGRAATSSEDRCGSRQHCALAAHLA